MAEPRQGAHAMIISEPLATELVAVANQLADAARATTLQRFRTPEMAAETKSAREFDPVTLADRETEARLRALLAELRPEDGILGEEFEGRAGASGLTWIIDPIDGTRGFLSGTPTWGVLIAVADADRPVLGVIDQPYTGERFIGGLGQARLTGPMGARPLAARAARPLDQAILFSTFPEIGSPAERAAFNELSGRVRLTRYGMDCYAYALLALGQIDLVVEAGLHPYDVAAPIAVIEAAGGIVTDWRGGPAQGGGRVLAAANARAHADALAILSRADDV